MSIVHTEMETFLSKFSLLVTYGVDTNLTFESKGGKISANLRADLGYLNAFFSPSHRPSKPSRIRRRQRRAAERTLNKENASTETIHTAEVDLDTLSNTAPNQPAEQGQDMTIPTTKLLSDKLKMNDQATLVKPELTSVSLPPVDIPPGNGPTLSIVTQPPISIPPKKIYHPAIIKACYAITGKDHPSQLLPNEVERFKKYIKQKRDMGEPVESDLLYLPTSMRNCVHCGHPT